MNIDKINDELQYRVELKERVEVLGNTLWPGQDVVLLGSVVRQIAGQVSHAEPV